MLKTMAMVTPCFAGTVFMSAKLFDHVEMQESKGAPLEEILDLLFLTSLGR